MSDKEVSRRLLLKTSFWYTLSMFVTRAIGFITMPIFTSLMTKEEYGNFSVFASWQAILLTVCSIDLYGTLNRARFDYVEKKSFSSYVTSSLVLGSIVTGVVCVLYVLFPHVFDRFFLIDRKYMTVMFAYLFAVPALNMFQTTQRLSYKYKLSATISIGVALLSPVFAVILVLLMKNDRLYGRIIGQYAPYTILGVVFYIYYLCQSRKIKVSNWAYALRIGIPLVFSYLGSRILLQVDTIVLKHMCTAEQVGTLSVSHSTSHLVLILVQTLNLSWAPWFYDMLKRKNYPEIRKLYKIYLWIMVAFTFVVLLIGPELVHFLGSGKYSESAYLLPANILCGVFTVLTTQFVNLETYHKKPEYAAILTGIVAALNIVLDIVGVKLWGYMAVCYTTIVCQILLITLHYIFTMKMSIREMLAAKTVVAAIGASVILIPVALLMYQHNVIRYTVAAVALIATIGFLVKYKGQIIGIVRKVMKKGEQN